MAKTKPKPPAPPAEKPAVETPVVETPVVETPAPAVEKPAKADNKKATADAYYAAMLKGKIAAGLREDTALEVTARQRAEDEANGIEPPTPSAG